MRRSREDDSEALRIEVSEQPPPARMTLYGEFDIRCADAATHALEELLGRGPVEVLIDLSRLEFMDSAGVRFLVEGLDRASERGVRLALMDGGEPVRRILTVSGVKALFEDAERRGT
jgi:anti-sigma B factor antagonist